MLLAYLLCHLANLTSCSEVIAGIILTSIIMVNMHTTSDSESDYFIDKWDISDVEDLHDCVSEDKNGGGKSDLCNVEPYLFEPEADESDIED
jgi:hypothetical protein